MYVIIRPYYQLNYFFNILIRLTEELEKGKDKFEDYAIDILLKPVKH